VWEVVYLPEAEDERARLPARDRVAVDNAVAKLEAMGPMLPYPTYRDIRREHRTNMVKISQLKTAETIRANDMRDPEYRREYERTRLANEVAIRVTQYRVKHGLSQAELARRLGMRQPNVARLESGEHEPTIATLSLLAQVLKQDFSVDVKPSRMGLRHHAPDATARTSSQGSARSEAAP
jgi:DNA-binding transcriptional regulator YiaG